MTSRRRPISGPPISSHERAIPASADRTVTFEMGDKAAKRLHVEGNLDIDDFGAGNGDYAPEEVFDQPELGVIRTY